MNAFTGQLGELRGNIGKEMPIDQFHLKLRSAARQIPGISAYGSCLVSCSDELLGSTRHSFDTEVAAPLISGDIGARDRVFSVSNLCGRLEPGTVGLVDNHFGTEKSDRGAKLLVFEIASHVGRLSKGHAHSYGQVERFGRLSPCCGALTLLLDPPRGASAVRHPWFEQLNAFFGPVRIAALRERDASTRMIAAGIVHAALQAESAISEVLYEPLPTTTHVLLVAGVVVNQRWTDGFLPVAFHHLRIAEGVADVVDGFGLRTTPEALDIDVSGALIRVATGEPMETFEAVSRRPSAAEGEEPAIEPEALAALSQLEPRKRQALESRIDAARPQIERIRADPLAWRTYARPMLRTLFRGLCTVEPELGIAAMLYEGGQHFFAAHRLKQILDHGPASAQGRRTLHDIEAELQQLNHEDAQQVLDVLLAKKGG